MHNTLVPIETWRNDGRSSSFTFKEGVLDLDDHLSPDKQRLLKQKVRGSETINVTLIIPTVPDGGNIETTVIQLSNSAEVANANASTEKKARWKFQLILALNGIALDSRFEYLQKIAGRCTIDCYVMRLEYIRGKVNAMNSAVFFAKGQPDPADILGFIDDDIATVHENAILHIIETLIRENETYFVGANCQWVAGLSEAENTFALACQSSTSRFVQKKGTVVGRGMFMFADTYPTIPPHVLHDDGYLRYFFAKPGRDAEVALSRIHSPPDAIFTYTPITNAEDYKKRRPRIVAGGKQLKEIFKFKDLRGYDQAQEKYKSTQEHEDVANTRKEIDKIDQAIKDAHVNNHGRWAYW